MPCSGHGECAVQTGICSCEIHWEGKNELDQNATYDCSLCSDGWEGIDCSTTTIFHNITDLRKKGVAIISGTAHITMFDGISLRFDIPGIYNLLFTDRSSISLFVIPCSARIACRQVAEIYISSGQQEVSVQVGNDYISLKLYSNQVWKDIDKGYQQSKSNGIGIHFRDYMDLSLTTLDDIIIDIFLIGDVITMNPGLKNVSICSQQENCQISLKIVSIRSQISS